MKYLTKPALHNKKNQHFTFYVRNHFLILPVYIIFFRELKVQYYNLEVYIFCLTPLPTPPSTKIYLYSRKFKFSTTLKKFL